MAYCFKKINEWQGHFGTKISMRAGVETLLTSEFDFTNSFNRYF